MSRNFKNSINYIFALLIIAITGIFYFKEYKVKPIILIAPENPEKSIKKDLTYEEALNKIKKDEEILIVFGADWCTWCKELEKSFKDEDVQKLIHKKKITEIHIDIDKRKDLSEKYSIVSVPVCAIINKKEIEQKRFTGYKDSKSLLDWLK